MIPEEPQDLRQRSRVEPRAKQLLRLDMPPLDRYEIFIACLIYKL